VFSQKGSKKELGKATCELSGSLYCDKNSRLKTGTQVTSKRIEKE